MVCPIPDAVVQKPAPDSPYGEILPFEQQPHSHILVRTAVGAAKRGKGWEYLNEVMRLVWNGQKVPWIKDDYAHVRNAIQAAGIDADELIKDVTDNPDKYDKLIQANMDLQLQNDARHTDVPCFVFRYEPFFGQDRMDQLVWRLKQYGLTVRADYEPSLRSIPHPLYSGSGVLVMEPASERDRYASMYLPGIFRRVNSGSPFIWTGSIRPDLLAPGAERAIVALRLGSDHSNTLKNQ
jgi:hypothetical protein